jgi:hypothetical protein
MHCRMLCSTLCRVLDCNTHTSGSIWVSCVGFISASPSTRPSPSSVRPMVFPPLTPPPPAPHLSSRWQMVREGTVDQSTLPPATDRVLRFRKERLPLTVLLPGTCPVPLPL